MKRFIVLFALLLGFITMPLAALDVPALKGHVNDYANMLTPAMAGVLEKDLSEFEKKESTQIVILTVPSLEGAVLEEYSLKVAEKWKIGRKKLDNGVIFLVSKNDRKMRIEVGYGLEGRLTDLLAGRIIDNDVKPFFKQGNYDAGIASGAHAIIRAVKGEYHIAEPPKESTGALPWYLPLLIIGGMLLFVGLIVLIAWKLAVAGGGGGYSSYSSGSSDSSSSGSSGSSGSDSGSSSGSDYSGGGGDFGGGGASGDW